MQPPTPGPSPEQEKRTAKALQGLAAGTLQIRRTTEVTWLAANGDGLPYNVVKTDSGWACTCLDWLHHCRDKGLNCKHVEAVRLSALALPHPALQTTEGDEPSMDDVIQPIITKLNAPFPASVINWKPQSISKDKTRALAVAYIDARDVMVRLDEVIGPFNWQVKHEQQGEQTVTGLGLKHPLTGEWIWKQDVGFVGGSESNNDDEQMKAIKGTASDGLKRAAVAWGIGRYLYSLPKTWVDYDADKRQLKTAPPLPKWALPEEAGHPKQSSDPHGATHSDTGLDGSATRKTDGNTQAPSSRESPGPNGPNGSPINPAEIWAARALIMTLGSDAVKGKPLGDLGREVWDFLATNAFKGDEALALQKAAQLLLATTPY